MPSKTLSQTKDFLKIWSVHIYVYYLIYGILVSYTTLQWKPESLSILITYPLMGGIAGWFDGCVAFFTIPILAMFLLTKFFHWNLLRSYLISIFVCHIVRFIVQMLLFEDTELVFLGAGNWGLKLLYLIIAQLIVSLLNSLLFRNKKKLGTTDNLS